MDKVILITGGTDGLGLELVKRLSKHDKLIVLARDKDKLQSIHSKYGCETVECDLKDIDSIEAAVNKAYSFYNNIDVLVNNAALWIQGPIDDNKKGEITDVINVNVAGLIELTRLVVARMKLIKKGRVINVISQGGLNAKSERSVYTASKWAVTGFTKSLQLELSSFGISVMGFYPGPMKTNFFQKAGINKDQTGYMELSEVVPSLEFMISLPSHLNIPELGIVPLK